MARARQQGPRPVADSECEPLLGRRGFEADNGVDNSNAAKKDSIYGQLKRQVTTRWAVWRIVIVVFLLYVLAVSTASEIFEVSRAIACARFYERNPQELLAYSELSPTATAAELCDRDEIEQRSNLQTSSVDAAGALFTIAGMLIFGPRLRQWGCKRVLLATMSLCAVPSLTYIVLPRGFPYGPQASEMAISPSSVSRIFVAASIIGQLAGVVMVPMCCLRLLMTDASSVSTKSANMQLLVLAVLLATTIGPALFSILSDTIPIYVDQVQVVFSTIWTTFCSTLVNVFARQSAPHVEETLPSPPAIGHERHSNVTVFILALLVLAAAITFISVTFPNDRQPSQATGGQTDEGIDGRSASKVPASTQSNLVRHLIPKCSADGSRDWRISTLFAVALLHSMANYVLTIYIQYFGHTLHWDAEWVGYLLSYLGAVRLFAIVLLVPILLAYYERTVRRPSVLRGMTIDEIKAHGSHSRADEAPTGTDASAFAPATTGAVDDGDEHEIEGAVATWRARVDRSLLKVSWSLDIVGWILVALATISGNTAANLLGGFFAAFGAGAMGARTSVDLSIIGDVFAREQLENEHEHSQDIMKNDAISPSQVYFSLLTIAEGCSSLIAPVIASSVYQSTLSSFPAANWLLASLYYALCIALHFSMPVHR